LALRKMIWLSKDVGTGGTTKVALKESIILSAVVLN
jgi:hypothetical protein